MELSTELKERGALGGRPFKIAMTKLVLRTMFLSGFRFVVYYQGLLKKTVTITITILNEKAQTYRVCVCNKGDKSAIKISGRIS
jgi:hypothetical protein